MGALNNAKFIALESPMVSNIQLLCAIIMTYKSNETAMLMFLIQVSKVLYLYSMGAIFEIIIV